MASLCARMRTQLKTLRRADDKRTIKEIFFIALFSSSVCVQFAFLLFVCRSARRLWMYVGDKDQSTTKEIILVRRWHQTYLHLIAFFIYRVLNFQVRRRTASFRFFYFPVQEARE